MSASGEWGTRLTNPDDMSRQTIIRRYGSAFRATERWQAANRPHDNAFATRTRIARIRANFTPPLEHLFAYQVQPGDTAELMTIQNAKGHPLRMHRDPVALDPWQGRWLLGNRLYFRHDLPGPQDPNFAYLQLVNTEGIDPPRQSLALPLGRLSVVHGAVEIAVQSPDMLDGETIDPADITAAALKELGLTEAPARLPRPSIETPEPRSRRSE